MLHILLFCDADLCVDGALAQAGLELVEDDRHRLHLLVGQRRVPVAHLGYMAMGKE